MQRTRMVVVLALIFLVLGLLAGVGVVSALPIGGDECYATSQTRIYGGDYQRLYVCWVDPWVGGGYWVNRWSYM